VSRSHSWRTHTAINARSSFVKGSRRRAENICVVEAVLLPEILCIFKQERVHGAEEVAREWPLRPKRNRETVIAYDAKRGGPCTYRASAAKNCDAEQCFRARWTGTQKTSMRVAGELACMLHDILTKSFKRVRPYAWSARVRTSYGIPVPSVSAMRRA
jgi:hypothetical protein